MTRGHFKLMICVGPPKHHFLPYAFPIGLSRASQAINRPCSLHAQQSGKWNDLVLRLINYLILGSSHLDVHADAKLSCITIRKSIQLNIFPAEIRMLPIQMVTGNFPPSSTQADDQVNVQREIEHGPHVGRAGQVLGLV